jgi:tetratricopeptide (TPR) repeat protein
MDVRAPVAVISPDHARRLDFAGDLLRRGLRGEAIATLRTLIAEAPALAHAHRLLGVGLDESGDPLAAEAAYRRALALDPGLTAAATGLAEVLRNADRGREAIETLAPFMIHGTRDLSLLTYYAFALQSVGRFDEALVCLQRAVETSPASAVAEHNLAGALGDSERYPESEAAIGRAMAKGLDAAESWLVLARALAAQDQEGKAEIAYHEAVKRNPYYADAYADWAQIIWTRTGDADAAMAVLDEVIEAQPRDPSLLMQKAKLLEYLGKQTAASETLAFALTVSDDPLLHVAAARLAAATDPNRALHHAQRAFALRPENYSVISTLCQVKLAMGLPDEAAPLAELLCERQGWDQYALALLATAWRLQGDHRYAELCDYDGVVRSFRLDTPRAWPSLESYLDDLRAALDPLHPFLGHPIGQSLRHGSQTRQDLTRAASPVIKAFFEAIDGPIRRYMEHLGPGQDPLRRRITSGYRFNGVWSVKLRPGAGFHTDHVHHKGWLSSACYIALPGAVEKERQGWIKFGEPGIPTKPALAPERFIKPEVGQLILFPSYLWHGTTLFTGDEPRLSVAFDVLPA